MANNPKKITILNKVTDAQLETLAGHGTVIKGGDTLTADEGAAYLTPDTSVSYAAQTLTTEQKMQARTNIGAGTSNFDGAYSSLSGAPTLATVATSGSYNDLTDKPTIPTGNDKVDKTSSANKVYGTDSNGDQTTYDTARTPQTIGGGKIPLYNAAGCLKTNSPTWSEDATPKSYVDNLCESINMCPSDTQAIYDSSSPVTGQVYFTATSNGVFYMRQYHSSSGTVGMHLQNSAGTNVAFNTQRINGSGYYNAIFVMSTGQKIYCYEMSATRDWGESLFVPSKTI